MRFRSLPLLALVAALHVPVQAQLSPPQTGHTVMPRSDILLSAQERRLLEKVLSQAESMQSWSGPIDDQALSVLELATPVHAATDADLLRSLQDYGLVINLTQVRLHMNAKYYAQQGQNAEQAETRKALRKLQRTLSRLTKALRDRISPDSPLPGDLDDADEPDVPNFQGLDGGRRLMGHMALRLARLTQPHVQR